MVAAEDERDHAGGEHLAHRRLDRGVRADGVGRDHRRVAEVDYPQLGEGVELDLEVRAGRAARRADGARREAGARAIGDEVVHRRADHRHVEARELGGILGVGHPGEREQARVVGLLAVLPPALLRVDHAAILRGRVARVDGEILEAVAAEAPAMTALLTELVAARTLLGDEAAGQAVMHRAFAELGLEPFEVPLDAAALDRHPAGAPFGWDIAGKANVLADWNPAGAADGRSLILNGHIDIVSPEPASLWTSDPYGARVEDEWMYGRGAGDMKSGLVAMIGAVRGLQRLGLAPRARVQLQSVVEEECTGNGALACVLAGHTADAAILTEPTGGAIWNAQVGVLWFQVRVLGAPAHAMEASEGANAIEASYAVIKALRDLEAELNEAPPPPFAAHPHPIHLNVGMIRGGDWPSTVAGECVTHCRLALYPGERVEQPQDARRADRRGGRARAIPSSAATASTCSTRASSARATSSRPTRRSSPP